MSVAVGQSGCPVCLLLPCALPTGARLGAAAPRLRSSRGLIRGRCAPLISCWVVYALGCVCQDMPKDKVTKEAVQRVFLGTEKRTT